MQYLIFLFLFFIVFSNSVFVEPHLKNIRNITNGGTNAEAYWSFDGKQFSFQAIRGELGQTHDCDQIYTMNSDGSNVKLISGGLGRTTCSYFLPDGEHVLYSSTKSGGSYCPPTPDQKYGYLWPLNKDMNIYITHIKSGHTKLLFESGEYNAESVISPNGERIIFTSAKDGDLELYTMRLNGSDIRRMTYTPGYDGGAWFSWDSKKIVWRANRPQGNDYTDYLNLLKFGLVSPTNMQIYWQDVELLHLVVQVTNNNGTNFSPVFTPDSKAIVFSSDMHAPNTGNFQLYYVRLDGTGLIKLTTEGTFNAFAMFNPQGNTLAWESNRGVKIPGDIDVFLADWSK